MFCLCSRQRYPGRLKLGFVALSNAIELIVCQTMCGHVDR
jgi:hypothetical protein